MACLIGKVVAKFCAKYLHQVVKSEANRNGDLCKSLQTTFLRFFMDDVSIYHAECNLLYIFDMDFCLSFPILWVILFVSKIVHKLEIAPKGAKKVRRKVEYIHKLN